MQSFPSIVKNLGNAPERLSETLLFRKLTKIRLAEYIDAIKASLLQYMWLESLKNYCDFCLMFKRCGTLKRVHQ